MVSLKYTITALTVWNVLVFVLYGVDKLKAKNEKKRISEKTLLMTAFFMGSVGAVIGMVVFRHKTKHWKFKILLPLFIILNVAFVIACYRFLLT
jgi:uncharacterized membrane protein YsdA (DUF1294 family)